MKELLLTTGEICLLDDEDFEIYSAYKWRRDKTNKHVCRTVGPKSGRYSLRIHREIMKAQKGELVDHRNGNTLDNQRNNLRFADKSKNGMNRGKPSNNTSGYKGITFHKQCNKWLAQISVKGKHISLGLYECKEDAAKAYNKYAEVYFGEFNHKSCSE